MPQTQSAYDMPANELLEHFAKAVNPEFSLEKYNLGLNEIFYLRGAMQAALENKRPPFKEGQQVRPKSEWGASIIVPFNAWDHGLPSGTYVVKRIYYECGKQRWLLTIENDPVFKNCTCLFPADEFEAVAE